MKKLILSGTLALASLTPTKVSDARPLPDPMPLAVAHTAVPEAEPTLLAFVKKSNPGLDTKEAARLAKLVEQVAIEYRIEVPLFAAIVSQESHFRTGLKACRRLNGIRRCDYGLAQVNSFWVDELELDANKLRYDERYNLNVAAGILRGVLDRHGDSGYGFYNTADPEMQLTYVRLIDRRKKQVVAMMN